MLFFELIWGFFCFVCRACTCTLLVHVQNNSVLCKFYLFMYDKERSIVCRK